MKFIRDRHYREHKDEYRARVVATRKRNSLWLMELKSKLKCSFCDEDHWACIDFHHKDNGLKTLNLAKAVHGGWSIRKLEEEVAKCIPVCSNCHRKITAVEQGWKSNINGSIRANVKLPVSKTGLLG